MSDDPSQVSTAVLIQSAKRDLGETQKHLQSFFAYFYQLQVTLTELERREAANPK